MADRFYPDKWELHASGVNTSTNRPDAIVPEGYASEAAAREGFRKMQGSGVRYTAALILPPAGSASEEPIHIIKPSGA